MNKPKSGSTTSSAPVHTRVITVDDLRLALREMLATQSIQAITYLQEAIQNLKADFEPSSVSMTTTNIPDSLEKLASVLEETTEATSKVFRLTEKQQHLLSHEEEILNNLEAHTQRGALEPNQVLEAIAQLRSTHQEIKASAHEIVLTQEFHDLTGQKIRKVIKVIDDLDKNLRLLLNQFNIEVPQRPKGPPTTENEAVDQKTTDAMLKELGV